MTVALGIGLYFFVFCNLSLFGLNASTEGAPFCRKLWKITECGTTTLLNSESLYKKVGSDQTWLISDNLSSDTKATITNYLMDSIRTLEQPPISSGHQSAGGQIPNGMFTNIVKSWLPVVFGLVINIVVWKKTELEFPPQVSDWEFNTKFDHSAIDHPPIFTKAFLL